MRLERIMNVEFRTLETSSGTCFRDSSGRLTILPVHPFQNVDHRRFAAVLEGLKEELGANRIAPLNVFEFERRPIKVLQGLRSALTS